MPILMWWILIGLAFSLAYIVIAAVVFELIEETNFPLVDPFMPAVFWPVTLVVTVVLLLVLLISLIAPIGKWIARQILKHISLRNLAKKA